MVKPGERPLNKCVDLGRQPQSPDPRPRGPVLVHTVARAEGEEEVGRKRPSVICLSCQGTTGKPKGATLSHHNIVNNSSLFGKRLELHLKVRGPLAKTYWHPAWVGPCWALPAG